MKNNQTQENFDVSRCFNNFLRDFQNDKQTIHQTNHLKYPSDINISFKKKLLETIKNGITRSQWNQIKNYSIEGNKLQRKKNYQIGINHLFNLRSMYRKINQTSQIKGKKQNKKTIDIIPKEKPIKKKVKNQKEVDQLFNTLTLKEAELFKQQIPKNFDDSFEISLDQKNLKDLQNKEKTKTKKKKINRKQKIKTQQILDQNENQNLQTNLKTKKKKVNTKNKQTKKKTTKLQIKKSETPQFDLQDFEDFKNTREMELIKKNLEIFDENQNFIDDESFQISRDIEKLTEYKMKKKEDEEISIISDKNSGFSDFGDDMKEKLNQILISDMQENNEDYLIHLKSLEQQQIQQFKKQIKETIFKQKIFEQIEFEKFLETLININKHIDSHKIQELFNDVKEELYEQFKDEIEDTIDNQNWIKIFNKYLQSLFKSLFFQIQSKKSVSSSETVLASSSTCIV